MAIRIVLSNPDDPIKIEAMGNTPQEVWRSAAQMANIAAIKECGNPECKSKEIAPSCRQTEKTDGGSFDKFAIECAVCGSSLGLGLNKEGGGLYLKWAEKWWIRTPKTDEPPI